MIGWRKTYKQMEPKKVFSFLTFIGKIIAWTVGFGGRLCTLGCRVVCGVAHFINQTDTEG